MEEVFAEARNLADQGLSKRAIAQALNISRHKVDEALAATNGHPIEGQQTIDGGEVPVERDGELRVDGTTQLGLFDAGGKKPQSASLTLAGGRIGLVDGRAFRKGETVTFSGVAVITAVALQDKRDKATGIPVSCEQKHTAVVTDLTVG
jgi:hypothetical protein